MSIIIDKAVSRLVLIVCDVHCLLSLSCVRTRKHIYCGSVAPHLLTYREVGTHFKVRWANFPPNSMSNAIIESSLAWPHPSESSDGSGILPVPFSF